MYDNLSASEPVSSRCPVRDRAAPLSPDGPVERRGAEIATPGVHLRPQPDVVGGQRQPVVDGRPVQQRHVDVVTPRHVIAFLDQLTASLQHAVLTGGGGPLGLKEGSEAQL